MFLRHVRTGHYYLGNSEWVVQFPDARDFGDIDKALEVVADDKLEGMSLVIRYDDSGREQEFLLSEGIPQKGEPKDLAQNQPSDPNSEQEVGESGGI